MEIANAGDEVVGPLNEAVDLETLAVGISPANQRTAASPDMTLSLPAVRNFQPADFASMREALFVPRPKPQAKAHSAKALQPEVPQGKASLQRLNRRRAAEGLVEPSRQENLRARVESESRVGNFGSQRRPELDKLAAVGKQIEKREGERGAEASSTTWVTRTGPLQTPAATEPTGESQIFQF